MLLIGGARDGLDIPDPGCEAVVVIVPVAVEDGWANARYVVNEDRTEATYEDPPAGFTNAHATFDLEAHGIQL